MLTQAHPGSSKLTHRRKKAGMDSRLSFNESGYGYKLDLAAKLGVSYTPGFFSTM